MIPATENVRASPQLPSVNGWRGVAILLVLGLQLEFVPGLPERASHFVNAAFDGLLGVRFFFTVSGFLITWSLLQEEERTGSVNLKGFYARRALRILPVYAACLLAMALLQWAGLVTQSGSVWIALLTFTRNFFQSGHILNPISLHFWSLAVEEQFYAFWPLIFVGLARSANQRIFFLLGTILFAVGFKIVALLGCYNRQLYFLFEQYSTLQFLDALGYGCLGAVLLTSHPDFLKNFFKKFLLPTFFLSLLLLLLPEFVGIATSLQSLGFILMLLPSVVRPDFKPFKFLNHPWLSQIGVLSYSLYVWQQLVFMLWPFPKLWFLALPMTFAAAALSYQFLEKPFFALRLRLRDSGGR